MSMGMFENIQRKIKLLETAVYAESDKYIDKFEALSISAVEVDEQISLNLPEMKKLKVLATELNYILNEAYIEQQTLLGNIKTELLDCNRTWETISTAQPRKDHDSSFDDSQVIANQLKHTLKHVYDQIVLIVDFKSSLLQSIQHVCDGYNQSIITIGRDSGVLQAQKKVSLVTSPHFTPLINNRFFSTQEEEDVLISIRSIWASAILKSPDHTLLAERQLSMKHFTRHSQSTNWQYYMKTGGILVLLLWALSECINNEISEQNVWNDQTFLIFLCLGDLMLLLFMWGVSMHVWRRAGIDFIKLLQLEDTELAVLTKPEETVYTALSNLSIFFLLAFILFNKSIRGGYFHNNNDITIAHCIPILLIIYCIIRIFYPYAQRSKWLYMLWCVVAAPWYHINFRAGYIGDLLTSLVRVFIPMCFSILYLCITIYAWLTNRMNITIESSSDWLTNTFYYKYGLVPVLTLFPLWVRLLQCLRRSVETEQRWPHIGNALKYTSAICVISYGIYQPHIRHNPVWVGCFVFATLYQFVWDLTQDWGMVIITPPKHILATHLSSGISSIDCLVNTTVSFRRTRLLGSIGIYILVIVLNLLLRFSWTLTLLPIPIDDGETSLLYISFMTHLGPLLASAEIVRRMVWGFFRLEYEQLEVIGRKKTNDILHAQESETEAMLGLDKMDVANTFEIEAQGSFTTTGVASSDELWTETDWIEYLPPYVAEMVYTSTWLRGFETYKAKVRFIEAIIFATVVVVIVAQAAFPVFHS